MKNDESTSASEQEIDQRRKIVTELIERSQNVSFDQRIALDTFLKCWGFSAIRSLSPPPSHERIIEGVYALAKLYEETQIAIPSSLIKSLIGNVVSIFEDKEIEIGLISKLIYAFGVLQFREKPRLEAIIHFVNASKRLCEATTFDMISLTTGFRLLGITDPYSLQPLTKTILTLGLGSFSDFEIDQLFFNVVQMQWKSESLEDLVAKEALRWDRIIEYRPRVLASICRTLSQSKKKKEIKLDSLVLYLTNLNRLETFDSQGLVDLAYAMKRLDVSDLNFWNQLIQSCCQPSRLKAFENRRLVSLIHSLGSQFSKGKRSSTLEIEVRNRLRTLSNDDLVIISLGLCQSSYARLQRRVLKELIEPDRLKGLSGHQLTGAFLSIRRNDWVPFFPTSIGRTLAHQLALKNEEMTPKSIGLTIYTLGILKDHSLASQAVLKILLAKAYDRRTAKEFTSQGWACLFFGLGELRFNDFKILNSLVWNVVRSNLNQFSTFEICNVFFGIGKCGYKHVKEIGILLGEILKKEREEDMNNGILVTLMLSLAYHGLEDNELIEKVIDRLLDISNPEPISKKQLSIVLYSLTVLNYAKIDRIEALLRKIFQNHEAWNEEDRKQLPWMIHTLGLMRYTNGDIWKLILDEVRRRKYELLSWMGIRELTGILYSLSKVRWGTSDLIQLLVNRLIKIPILDRMDSLCRLKVLESITTLLPEKSNLADEVMKRLLVRCRIKTFGQKSMLRIMNCFFRTQMLQRSTLSNWILTEFLFFKNGILMSRLMDDQLLYLVHSLEEIHNRNYPYFDLFVEALKSEIFSIQRRQSIRMQDMIQAISKFETIDRKKQNARSTSPSNLFLKRTFSRT